MEAFRWSKYFETGLTEVDQQHIKLVLLINNFDSLVQNSKTSPQDIETVFRELVDYTQYHFREEEAMMVSVGLDARFVNKHIEIHVAFLDEIIKLNDEFHHQNLHLPKRMLSFLVQWLAFHILGVDQSMSRQVSAVQAGQSAAEVFLDEERITQTVTDTLLNALNALFQQISDQNHELLELNQSLEIKVATRTEDLKNANLNLEEMAMTDALSGLPNRRNALARLSKEWEESVRNDKPLACMMIDADGFKRINDTYGHDAGDEVLRQLSKHLLHSLRSDDVVCRLGGDEFFVICPNTSKAGALHIAEIMRSSVAALRIPAGTGEWVGSVSVGVAARTAEMKVTDELMKMADEGVYLAKRNGRNCVESL
jgi:hemerythrin